MTTSPRLAPASGSPLTPAEGALVRVRSRQYLVQKVFRPRRGGDAHLVRLACVEDYAQGEKLEVLWEQELDGQILEASWDAALSREFDAPDVFGAYLSALRWSCVTATEPERFQAPFRAGIEVLDYQLAPLERALALPRVNVFIADDVGLGKTIEAGLILRELILRQRVTKVLVLAPASVTRQWQEELSERFGLDFTLYDRDFVLRTRRTRGWRVNPFDTGSHFILSHSLLHSEAYRSALGDWLGEEGRGAFLILDEAHHAAPAGAGTFGVDTQFTTALESIVERFEHRLFLSATPHNGHPSSFSALLSLLDPIRFVRSTPVLARHRDEVMVRRLKSDLRRVTNQRFPDREIEEVVIQGIPEDAPELVLARLLDTYNELREARFAGARPSDRSAHDFVSRILEKRLLSSIIAFRDTLGELAVRLRGGGTLRRPAEWRDEEGDDEEDETQREERQQILFAQATARLGTVAPPTAPELALLDRLTQIASQAAHLPDQRVKKLVAWITQNQCPDLGRPGAAWNQRRVLIFTEWAATLRYLQARLQHALAGSHRADERIALIHGGMTLRDTGLPYDEDAPADPREAVKRAFNGDPSVHPVRILLATDSAREGINLQRYCHDLFHFDLPWNPTRLEQRNGRIDRKGQRADTVFCRYFHYSQRAADAITRALVKKTEAINRELGSINPVLARQVVRMLDGAASPGERAAIVRKLDEHDHTPGEVVQQELETVRRVDQLERELARLQGHLKRSEEILRLSPDRLRWTLDAALRHHGLPTFSPRPMRTADEPIRYSLPAHDQGDRATPAWSALLDTLRAPREPGEKPWDWHRRAPPRAAVFVALEDPDDATVQLHLEHRLVRQLLARFLSQGFPPAELAGVTVASTSAKHRHVFLIGRLSLFGRDAARLHDELVLTGARIEGPTLDLLPEADEADHWTLLDDALHGTLDASGPAKARLHSRARGDLSVLRGELDTRLARAESRAKALLEARGKREAEDLRKIIGEQLAHCRKTLAEFEKGEQRLPFATEDAKAIFAADRDDLTLRVARLTEKRGEITDKTKNDYVTEVTRVLPVGLVYLLPRTG